MKKKLVILLAALIATGAVFSPTANAVDIRVNIGDRPYYAGNEFWDWGWHYVWVPGHMQHGRWIHGHYERRGDWNIKFAKKKHRWHKHRF